MTQWLSQWVTRSPIELFWTSRNSSQFDNYFENNKNYSSLSDSKKSMHLKYSENTGSQNRVYKSRSAHLIQIKMFLEHQILICEKIHSCQSMNFDLVWWGIGWIWVWWWVSGKLSKNVWFVWSKSGDVTDPDGQTNKQQGKIELLSFWSVRSWVSQFNIAFCCLNLSDATPVRLNLWQGRGGQTISASFSTPDRRLWCFYRKMLCQIYVAKTP